MSAWSESYLGYNRSWTGHQDHHKNKSERDVLLAHFNAIALTISNKAYNRSALVNQFKYVGQLYSIAVRSVLCLIKNVLI